MNLPLESVALSVSMSNFASMFLEAYILSLWKSHSNSMLSDSSAIVR